MQFSHVLSTILILLVSKAMADMHWYTFWAADRDNSHRLDVDNKQPHSNAEFEARLRYFAEKNTMYASTDDTDGPEGSTSWWSAQLKDDVFDQNFKDLKIIGATEKKDGGPDDPPDAPPSRRAFPTDMLIEKRANETTTTEAESRNNVQRVLKFISMPASANNDVGNPKETYNYDPSLGKGTRIYIMDSGINPDHSAFKNRNIDWIWAEPFPDGHKRDVGDDHLLGHGSKMADLAAGNFNGVASKADITAVAMNYWVLNNYAKSQMIDGLQQIHKDLVKRKNGVKSVVLITTGWPATVRNTAPGERFYRDFFDVLQKISNLGAAIVVAPDNTNVDHGPPFIYADPNNDLKLSSLITVGAGRVDTGLYYDNNPNRQAFLTVFGPAIDVPSIQGASGHDNNKLVNTAGTSPASAVVAGLMAYFKGLGANPTDARKMLTDLAYPRNNQGPLMPFNGYRKS